MIPLIPFPAYPGWRGRQQWRLAIAGVLANSYNVEIKFYF
jgi:hypothetical protein